MRVAQKIIGSYFFIGAIAAYIFYFTTQTSDFLLYLVISYYYLKNPMGDVNENAFMIMLLIQSLGIQLFGFGFNNVYFPDLSIKINLKELSDINFQFRYFYVQMQNGYFRDISNNSISINLLLLLLMFFIPYFSKKINADKKAVYINSEVV